MRAHSFRGSTVVFALVLCAAPAVAACSSAEPESPPSDVRPTVAEQVAFHASDETRGDTGVVVWGANGAAGAMRVSGYDAHGSSLVVIEQRTVVVDPTHHYFETTLTGLDQNARMRMDGTVGAVDATSHFDIELRPTENTFEDSPRAQSILDHLRTDMEQGTATAPSLLQPQTVQPKDGTQLVQRPCTELLKSCGSSIVRFGAPLLPCASLARSALVVIRCALVGAVAGPFGALAGGAACATAMGPSIVVNTAVCAARAQNIYDNFGSRTNDMTTSCGQARTGCTGGGGAAMSTMAPPLAD